MAFNVIVLVEETINGESKEVESRTVEVYETYGEAIDRMELLASGGTDCADIPESEKRLKHPLCACGHNHYGDVCDDCVCRIWRQIHK